MMCIVYFAVGKTSLITRFMYDSFDNTYQVSYIRMSVQCLHVYYMNAQNIVFFRCS